MCNVHNLYPGRATSGLFGIVAVKQTLGKRPHWLSWLGRYLIDYNRQRTGHSFFQKPRLTLQWRFAFVYQRAKAGFCV